MICSGRGPGAVALALVLSVALHAGLALALRSFGIGPARQPTVALPPLYVDLIEPLVALPDGRSGSATAPAPPPARSAERRAASRAPAAAPASPPVIVDSGDRSAEVPALVPSPPPAAPALPPVTPAPPSAPPAALPEVASPTPTARSRGSAGDAPSRREGEEPLGASLALSTEGDGLAGGGGASDARTSRGPAGGGPGPDARGSGAARAEGVAALPGRGGDGAATGAGRGGGVPPEYERFVQALRRRIAERLRYPWLAVRQGLAGTVELEVRLDASGRLIEATTLGGAPARVLHEAAVQAVRDATPFPFPPGLEARALTIRLPIVFELH